MWSKVKKFDPTRLTVWASVVAAVGCGLVSLTWKMVQDTPVMLYQAKLMEAHGMMPYRDFFCINMPGALWVYEGMLRVCGVSDVALHLVNLAIVGLIACFICLALPRRQRFSGGLLAAALGALRIYSGESYFILQRELLALVPLAAAAFVGLRRPLPGFFNDGVLGFLVAALVLIKPQFVLFGLPVLALIWLDSESWRKRIGALVAAGLTFSVILGACGFWLYRNGAFPRLAETLTYWTLYGQMTQNFTFLAAAERLLVILRLTLKMIFSPYTAVALVTLVVGWRQRVLERREVIVWGGMPAVALLILAIGGQFWGYHKLPFFFFSLVAASRLIVCRGAVRWLATLMAAAWILFSGQRVWRETSQPSLGRLKQGVAAEFTRYLRDNLRPGERVQPMDWTYAALHAMLLVDAPPATRFLEYSYFLHSVSHPLIIGFRQEFMAQLEAHPPAVILEACAQDWPNGIDTEERFVAFEAWRDANYQVAEESAAYRIWRRNE